MVRWVAVAGRRRDHEVITRLTTGAATARRGGMFSRGYNCSLGRHPPSISVGRRTCRGSRHIGLGAGGSGSAASPTFLIKSGAHGRISAPRAIIGIRRSAACVLLLLEQLPEKAAQAIRSFIRFRFAETPHETLGFGGWWLP